MLDGAEHDIASFVAAQDGCDPERDLHPWLVAAVLLAAHHATVARWAATGADGDPRELLDAALRQAAAGLHDHAVPHHPAPHPGDVTS